VDDAACVFHRVPVGSGGRRQACGVHLSIARFVRIGIEWRDSPSFLPRLALGVALTGFLAVLNYRGIRWSASFQNWTTGIVLLLFVLFLGISADRGTPANFHPAFRTTPFVSILLTLQIVPYFMTGFESVPKVAEEAHQGFRSTGFFRAIMMALLVGAGFYVLAVAAVAYVAPWQGLIGNDSQPRSRLNKRWERSGPSD